MTACFQDSTMVSNAPKITAALLCLAVVGCDSVSVGTEDHGIIEVV